MILDPAQFVPTEMSRHLVAAHALVALPRPRRRARRGLVLRLASWATGRAMIA